MLSFALADLGDALQTGMTTGEAAVLLQAEEPSRFDAGTRAVLDRDRKSVV